MNELKPELKIEKQSGESSQFDSGAKMQIKPVGGSGTELFSGYFSEEYLQSLRGRRGAKIYDEMRRSETQVAMLLNAVMNPIKSGAWEFEAAAEVEGGEIQKEFIEFCAKSMIDWETHLHEALTLLVHGFSIFEVINNVVFNHPKFGTFNGLKALAFRSQKTIERWNIDRSTGDLKTVDQLIQGDTVPENTTGGGIVSMDAQFLLVFTLQKEGDNYEGISALRPMYGPWFRKNLYLKLAGIGLEKAAIGTPMGTIPAGKQKDEEVENFKNILSNFAAHESSYLLKPAGWEVEILQNEFKAGDVKEMILLENTEMINSLVANFLALGTNGGGGAFALGSDLSDFFLTGIQNYANIIAGVWNRKLIPDLVKINFGPQAAYPKLKVTGINDKAGKELADILNVLIGSNAVKADMKLEEFLRKVYSLPSADLETTRSTEASISVEANPNLPGTEAGIDSVDVQKLSLNGAQVASLLSIIQRVAIGLLPRETGVQTIQSAFNMSPEQAEAIMGGVGKSFVIDPAAVTAAGLELSEARIKLADTWKAAFNENKKDLKIVMEDGLGVLYENQKAQIKSKYKSASPAQKQKIALELEPRGLPAYKASLKESLAEVASKALNQAKKETPKSKDVKLSERYQLAAPRGGYFDALPPKIKTIVKNASELIGETQYADLNKIVSFQYQSSVVSTENVDQILLDIDEAVLPTIESGAVGKGMSIDAAAANAIANVSNQSRMTWFFEPEVLETIESFTFYNEDPVAPICQELDGTTWAANDPDLDRYTPPLHHNCKSRVVPNIKGDKGNPEISGTQSISQKGLDSVTLCECNYHLEFKLKENAADLAT